MAGEAAAPRAVRRSAAVAAGCGRPGEEPRLARRGLSQGAVVGPAEPRRSERFRGPRRKGDRVGGGAVGCSRGCRGRCGTRPMRTPSLAPSALGRAREVRRGSWPVGRGGGRPRGGKLGARGPCCPRTG
ncbi:protein SPT2 homolog [Vombatus ursinus]|uniref:protein SPT2 homolog n=1 Tax=Vombatus ursinus TaxID=29139 RepID=UPI000FFD2ADA|nr:protein SPT2 homolog [Vombatus ursinus]